MKSKNLFTKLIMAGLLTAGLAGCAEDDPTRVTGVEISEKTMNLEMEDTCELTCTVIPDTAVNTLVTYSSTDESILSVTNNPVESHTPVTVTALKDGKASIIVTTNDGRKTDKCDFTVTTSEYSIVSDITVKESFISYKNKRKEGLSDAEQFPVTNLEYNVGSNNPINLMPDYMVWSEEAQDFVDNSKWKYPHDIKVEIKGLDGTYNTADESYYSIVSNRSCDIKFNTNAVGKVFKVSITPGNLSADFKAKHPNTQTAVYDDLKIIDGYNIYTANELSLIDTKEEEADNPWFAFKSANNIDLKLHPTTLVIHNNLDVKVENLPADFFWSGLDGNFAKYNGTLKDWSEVYHHTTGDNVNVYGNYFKIDFSSLPVVEYKNGEAISDSFVSHAVLICMENGSASFNNLNLLGNAPKSSPKADGSQDTSGRGGFIFCKGRWNCDSVVANNNLFRSWFITYMGEDASNDVGYVNFVLNNCKGRDNYNSFLYNWGGKMTCNKCSFKSCGGPIIIQDHIDVEGNDYGSVDGSEVKGKTPSTTFIDCELLNYVAGTEAWFVQFGATAVVSKIKQMSDLYLSRGAAYLVAENPSAAGTYVPCASSSATSQATGGAIPYITPNFFNFIAINKSGSAEGMTNAPVHGEVSIINTVNKNNNKYCYSRPNMYSTSEIQELITLAIKYGLYTAENAELFKELEAMKDSADVNTATDKALCTAIRQLNGNGAPVFQCGKNFATLLDESNPSLIDVKTVGTTNAAAAEDFASYVSPVDGTTVARQDSTAIYFNGMMLVFGLTGFNL